MAIQYARMTVVSGGAGSSAVGSSAYLSRELRIEYPEGKVFDFRAKDGDLLARAIELPKNAPEWARKANGETLWNRAHEAEYIKDGSRMRVGAQLAYSVILALPKELELEQNTELLRTWIEREYTGHGFVVEWAIHAPDAGSPDNVHAHVLVSTRALAEDGFGAKIRGVLGRTFSNGALVAVDDLGSRWRAHQEGYFVARGLDATVDPIAAVPRLRAPREAIEGRPQSEYARLIAEENARRAQESRELLRDPDNLLELVTETHAVFTARVLETALRKAGIEGEEATAVLDAAIARSVALVDADGRDGYYTTPAVLADESSAVNLAVGIAQRSHVDAPGSKHVARAAEIAGLDAEQRRAVEAATLADIGAGLTIWRGIAGAGKSRAAGAARDAYEAAGWRVIGAAPTNTVARDMGDAGFASSTTIARLLWQLDKGKEHLDARTLLVVDEAAMVSTSDYVRLLAQVWKSGGRLLLVGDDRQLGSVARGGLFRVLVETLGCEELVTVRRQRDDAQQEATRLLAAGAMREALEIYHGLGAVRFAETGAAAARELVADWGEAARTSPEGVRFVYARTNAEVNALNLALAAEARRLGLVRGPEYTYSAKRGDVTLAAGDRIAFRSNDRRLELYNGYCGTVLAVSRERVEVRLDSGREVAFDPAAYTDFQLGYAGTVYRGQGKTQTTVFALHGSYSDSASAYVQLTRHTGDLRVYAGRDVTPDLDAMARQMGRSAKTGAALLYRPVDGERRLLDQALALPEFTVREGAPELAPATPLPPPESAPATPPPPPAPSPPPERAAPPDSSAEKYVHESWQELRQAMRDERQIGRDESAYRAELTTRFLMLIERETTGQGETLKSVFGRDDEALRASVVRAISDDAWDPDNPLPGAKSKWFRGAAYRSLRSGIANSRQVWRTTAQRRIDSLVRDRFGTKRADTTKRIQTARKSVVARVDAACRPGDHALVARIARAAKSGDPQLSAALAARAERLRQLSPEAVAGTRRRLSEMIARVYSHAASRYPKQDPRQAAAEQSARALIAWIQSAKPESLPASERAHSSDVLAAAAKAAHADPADAAARRAVAASKAYETAKELVAHRERDLTR